ERPRADRRRPMVSMAFRHVHPAPGREVARRNRRRPASLRHRAEPGLQFHPEVTPEIMDAWVQSYRHELDADGVDPDALLEETRRRAPVSRRLALRLLNRYLDAIVRLRPEAASR